VAEVASNSKLAFGLYEVDLQAEEIYKAGFRVKLQSQPFKVLAALLERPGHVVTRDDLQLRLWGKDTVVDFDHSLGTAVNKIREALGDSAENPRFIETLSKRGYRFIAPVQRIALPAISEAAVALAGMIEVPGMKPVGLSQMTPVEGVLEGQRRSSAGAISLKLTVWRGFSIASMLAVLLAFGIAAGYWAGHSRSASGPPTIRQITRNGHFAPGAAAMEDLAEADTDGVRLFASMLKSGQSELVSVALAGGMLSPVPTPAEVAGPAMGDLSPDGSRLLLRSHLSRESEQPLWVVPSNGGSALRVGSVLAHDAAWMPDGEGILYAAGNELYLTRLTDNNPQIYASLPGRAFWLRWSPDGKLLRFTIIDPIVHTMSLWQIAPKNMQAQRVLSGWDEPANECCGVWTADGRSYVFQATHAGTSNLWKLAGNTLSGAARLTDGPLQFQAPVAARRGSEIYFLGVDSRSEMERFEPQKGLLLPQQGFLSDAIRVDYSRDLKWVAWTTEEGALWRARADGSERLQLTPVGLEVFLAYWSPEGSRLAAMAREPGKSWQIYIIEGSGGRPQKLLQEQRNSGDPTWGPDGQTLVFGRVNDVMGKESESRTIQTLDLKTGKVEKIPGSEGLFSPRWSPDGRYIAALTIDQRHAKLYTLATKAWAVLPVDSAADPRWSADSHYLYLHEALDRAQPIVRIRVPENVLEPVVELAEAHRGDAADFVFGGLAPGNVPLVRSRVFTGNFYSLDLAKR